MKILFFEIDNYRKCIIWIPSYCCYIFFLLKMILLQDILGIMCYLHCLSINPPNPFHVTTRNHNCYARFSHLKIFLMPSPSISAIWIAFSITFHIHNSTFMFPMLVHYWGTCKSLNFYENTNTYTFIISHSVCSVTTNCVVFQDRVCVCVWGGGGVCVCVCVRHACARVSYL